MAELRAQGKAPPDKVFCDPTPDINRCQSPNCAGGLIPGGYWTINEGYRSNGGIGPVRLNIRRVVCYQCLHRIIEWNEQNGYLVSDVEPYFIPLWMSKQGLTD